MHPMTQRVSECRCKGEGKVLHADVGTTCHLVDQHFGGIDGEIGYDHVCASPFDGG